VLNKVSVLIRQDTAVGYYRLLQPLKFLVYEGYCKEGNQSGFSGTSFYGEDNTAQMRWDIDKTLQAFLKRCDGSDIIWTNFTPSTDEILKLMDLRKHTGAKIVVDVDDNLQAVTLDNPASTNARTFRPNLELSLVCADGITTSVPVLKEQYSRLNKNIFVQPNGIDLDMWKFKNKPHKRLRIMWRGAYGHRADLDSIKGPLKAIMNDYKVEFITMGAEPPFNLARQTSYKTVDFTDYPQKLADINPDIAIVPLIDSAYNRSKSNLAVLEFSALKIPVIASPTENQKGMKCLYAETNYEWYEQLEKLIKNQELRKKTSQNQWVDLNTRFNMKILVKDLANWFENLDRRKDLEP
jgi:glycosyltransferase involved in cell wall biosynthesis